MNARFWEYINDGYVKITLKPQQSLTHYRGGSTDEGWWSEQNTWSFDGSTVKNQFAQDGRDCDGRLSSGGELTCPVEKLAVVLPRAQDAQFGITVPRPQWEKVKASRRDYTAEAAGY